MDDTAPPKLNRSALYDEIEAIMRDTRVWMEDQDCSVGTSTNEIREYAAERIAEAVRQHLCLSLHTLLDEGESRGRR